MRLEIDRWMIADNHPTHPYKVIVDARSVGCGHRQSPARANRAFRKPHELYLQGHHQIVEISRRYSRKRFAKRRHDLTTSTDGVKAASPASRGLLGSSRHRDGRARRALPQMLWRYCGGCFAIARATMSRSGALISTHKADATRAMDCLGRR